jgi:hypothetical protein
MATSRVLRVAALGAALFASACAPQQQPLYRWGRYEDLIYDMYARPGKADPGTQIARLTEDVQRTLAEGLHVPPGVHAHLGYLYYTQGQVDLAAAEFATEKQLFPESAVFIDGILARMQRRAERSAATGDMAP